MFSIVDVSHLTVSTWTCKVSCYYFSSVSFHCWWDNFFEFRILITWSCPFTNDNWTLIELCSCWDSISNFINMPSCICNLVCSCNCSISSSCLSEDLVITSVINRLCTSNWCVIDCYDWIVIFIRILTCWIIISIFVYIVNCTSDRRFWLWFNYWNIFRFTIVSSIFTCYRVSCYFVIIVDIRLLFYYTCTCSHELRIWSECNFTTILI